MPINKHFMAPQYFPEGFATLTSVLLAGGIASAIAVTLLLSGVASSRNSLTTILSAQANALAHTCSEKALQTIHDSITYSGQGSLSIDDGSCTYTVSIGAGPARTITTSGVVSNVTRKIQVEVGALTPKIIVSSWQEVADF